MKRLMLMFVLLLGVSFVFAADGWGDTNTGGGGIPVVSNNSSVSNVPSIVYNVLGSSDAETRYTQDFYIALGVAGGGILIALLFIYLFFRSPKNRWKKKDVRNVSVVKR